MPEIDPSKLLIWKNGRPADIWLSQHELVASVIKRYRLKPLAVESYPSMPGMDAGMFEATAAVSSRAKSASSIPVKLRWPKPFPGGLRIPHVHYGADIYLLNDAQWKAFSSAVLKDVSKRIAAAKSVSFEQTLELADAINTLG